MSFKMNFKATLLLALFIIFLIGGALYQRQRIEMLENQLRAARGFHVDLGYHESSTVYWSREQEENRQIRNRLVTASR